MDALKSTRASYRRHATNNRKLCDDYIKDFDEFFIQKKVKDCETALQNLTMKCNLFESFIGKIGSINPLIYALIPSEIAKTIDESEDKQAELMERLEFFKMNIGVFSKRLSETPVVKPEFVPPREKKPKLVKLQTLQFKKFDGTLTKYKQFIDNFKHAVDDQDISPIMKFQYLMSYLEGDALEAVDGYDITEENYVKVKDILAEEFGNERVIKADHMRNLNSISCFSTNIEALKHFRDQLNRDVRSLEGLKVDPATYEELLIPSLVERIPSQIYTKILEKFGKNPFTLKDIIEAFSAQIYILKQTKRCVSSTNQPVSSLVVNYSNPDMRKTYNKQPHQQNYQNNRHPKSSAKFNNNNSRQLKCSYCKADHFSDKCTKTSGKQRWDFVKVNRLCQNCLSNKHFIRDCHSLKLCFHCNGRHHTSLHEQVPTSNNHLVAENTDEPNQRESTASATNPVPEQPTSTASICISDVLPEHVPNCVTSVANSLCSRESVLLKTARVTAVGPSCSLETHVLFDSGAMRTFICKSLADELHLEPIGQVSLKIAPFGAKDANAVRRLNVVTLHLRNDSNELFKINATVVPTITTPIVNDLQECPPHLQGLKLAIQPSVQPIDIQILIGSDQYWSLIEDEIIRGYPCAIRSKFGYVLNGPTSATLSSEDRQVDLSVMLNVLTDHFPEQDIVSKFFDLESIGIKDQIPNAEPKPFSLKEFCEKSIQFKDNAYTTELPFRSDPSDLPSNFNLCEKVTRATARKLAKEPGMLDTYNKIFEEQLARGFIEEVPASELDKDSNVFYVPHHHVTKDSATTPIRIVFNASSHAKGAPSLNDFLEQGPALQLDITSLLMRFRLFEIATSSDLEKAFLHVFLNDESKDFTRFFWLTDPLDCESPFKVYRYRVLIYGAKPSPFILNAIVYFHLLRQNSEHARTLERSVYIDNFLNSLMSEATAVEYYHESRKIMKAAGFNLRSWCSNSKSIADLAKSDNVNDPNKIVSILGMKWNTESDEMGLRFKLQSPPISLSPDDDEITTKREVLKTIGSAFDPLGLFSPIVLRGKTFLKDLWRQKAKWDLPIPTTMDHLWIDIFNDLHEMSEVSFPRSLDCDPKDVELHIFCDASKSSYSAVCYLKSKNQVNLLFSRNRLSPMKELTIPRLELMGAVISVRLACHVNSTIKPAVSGAKTFFWCDSQVVLHWINSTRKLKTFVANRVKEITQSSSLNEWRYCPTKDNPADIATRGCSLEDLLNSRLWWKGPLWLTHESWPVWSVEETGAVQYPDVKCETILLEVEKEVEHVLLTPEVKLIPGILNIVDIDRYNNWSKLLRVVALVTRFIRRIKDKQIVTGHIKLSELKDAEFKVIEHTQKLCFTAELFSLSHKPEVKRHQPPLIRQLSLFIDNKKLIRSYGRVQNSSLSYDAMFPILLPKSHKITTMIVNYVHKLSIHSKVNYTLVLLRQKFWIPKGRQFVKSVLNKCVPCRRTDGPAYRLPPSPPLPAFRVQLSRPYESCGLDYTGELKVKLQGDISKVYILLFTCTVIRHVHLEVVMDMSLNSFLLAFRRFCSKISKPKLLISDNGLSFVAASRLFNLNEAQNSLSNDGIDWKFIPKRSPWMGGFWEKMVGVIKKSLRRAIGKSLLSYEELITVVAEVQCAVNDRPLTYVNSDVGSLDPLTPAELFNGRRNTYLPLSDLEQNIDDPTYGEDLRARQSAISKNIQNFWERWRLDYLTSLREHHHKFGDPNTQVRVGDVVLIDGENFTKRHQWKLGIVTKLHPGKDNIVRSVDLKTANGETSRPLVKLYPLEVSDENFASVLTKKTLSPVPSEKHSRPVRACAVEAKRRIKEILTKDDD